MENRNAEREDRSEKLWTRDVLNMYHSERPESHSETGAGIGKEQIFEKILKYG
jgi:hypothetical protein